MNEHPQEAEGGPAFPQTLTGDPGSGVNLECFGLSVRDYFAAKALHVVHSNGGRYSEEGLKMVAEQCYLLADAMLKARQA